MIYKNKGLLITACNLIQCDKTMRDSTRSYAKRMYKYLLNCGKNEDWYFFYRSHTLPRFDLDVETVYRSLIRSLNNFNRFKVF